MKQTRAIASLALTGVLVLSACGGKSSGADESTGEDGVVMGPGVTDDTISLASMPDLTGPFAVQSAQQLAAIEIYWKDRNAAGGVCGRSIELEVRDHGYEIDSAKSIYPTLSEDTAAIQQFVGTPVAAAMRTDIESDGVVSILSAFGGSLLGSEFLFLPGTVYQIEAANGIEWLSVEQGLAAGDTVGVLYAEGEYGESSLAGVEFAAAELGFEVVAQQIANTDTDVSAAVSAFEGAGVDFIYVATPAAPMNSLVSLVESRSLDALVLASGSAFDPNSLKTDARNGLLNAYFTSSTTPYAADTEGTRLLQAAWDENTDDLAPGAFASMGFAMASIMDAILTDACDDKALTREGIAQAAADLGEVDNKGTMTALDYTDKSVSPSLETSISRPDPNVDGGLVVVEQAFQGDLASEFTDY